MEQEFKKVAIIGGGPAGCFCGYFLQNDFRVTIFEKNQPLKTLLPTGGGRCNLAPAVYDFKELASNYPRGEKFLYSVFSQFGVSETLEVFRKIGIETYTQPDGRIFPVSNNSSDVRKKLLNVLNVEFIKDNICEILPNGNDFTLKSENKSYDFDIVVIATGGHVCYTMIEKLGHTIIPPKPALVGLKTEVFSAGVSLKNICARVGKTTLYGDLLFTHEGISGPLAYKISSIKARDEFPYKITLDFLGQEIGLQELFNKNPHKTLKNLLSQYLPKTLITEIIENSDIECHKINSEMRKSILSSLREFELSVYGTSSGGETVTSGGVALNEINSKTMMSKLIKNLYFCGEVIDVDGFCGGFNLQNCWATAYVAAQGIKNQ